MLGLPSVGVTHRLLVAHGAWPADAGAGALSPIRIDGELIGYWLRTRAGARPLAVHAGWGVAPTQAVEIVRSASGRARTPEPLRQARRLARTARAKRALAFERSSRGKVRRNMSTSEDKPPTGFPEPPGRDPGDISQHEDPHHALNTPVGEPDPTEWPDPYEQREDPRDPADPDNAPFGEQPHPRTGSTSTSEPHPAQDPEAEPWEGPKRDKVDE